MYELIEFNPYKNIFLAKNYQTNEFIIDISEFKYLAHNQINLSKLYKCYINNKYLYNIYFTYIDNKFEIILKTIPNAENYSDDFDPTKDQINKFYQDIGMIK